MKNRSSNNSRISEMRKMRDVEGMTQAAIARHYRISRQRVSQLIGDRDGSKRDGSRGPRPEYPQLRDQSWWEETKHRTTGEITRDLGCNRLTVQRWRQRSGVGMIPETATRVGEDGEQLVLERLRGFGFEPIYLSGRHPFDIEVAGQRIDVKTSSSRQPNPAHPSPRYSFTIKAGRLHEADFYILVAMHPGDWACFVIPIAVLADGRTAVQFPWPAHNPIENPWVKYLERWDLLGIL